jgi:hypothetical protein
MKKLAKIFLLVAGVTLLASVALAAGGSHVISGKALPQNTNYLPTSYKVWMANNSSQTSSGVAGYSATNYTYFMDNVNNFNPSWSNGQIVIGIMEKASAAESGAGLFSVSSITLSDLNASQNFTPDLAALANVPQPTATANAGAARIDLTWPAASGPAGTIVGYNVYRSSDGGTNWSAALNGGTPVVGTTYSDTTGTPGLSYVYATRVVLTGGVATTYRSLKSNPPVIFPSPVTILTITTASPLATGTVGTAYSQTLAAINGTPPYSWSITAGSIPGLVLSSAGVLSGTPTTQGTYNFTVQVTGGGPATKAFALTVNPSGGTGPTISGIAWDTSNPDNLKNQNNVYGTIIITGTNFGANPGDGNRDTAANHVTIGGITVNDIVDLPAPADNGIQVYSWSATSIVCGVPLGVTAGDSPVVVTAGSQASNSVNISVRPKVYGVQPVAGKVGDSVHIGGTAFGANPANVSVTFNGTAATPFSISDTSIEVLVPAGATTGQLLVNVNGKSSNTNYEFSPFALIIYTVSGTTPETGIRVTPPAAPCGTKIAITYLSGRSFGDSQTSSDIWFINNVTGVRTTVPSTSIIKWSDTSIEAIVPSLTEGSYTIKVHVPSKGSAVDGNDDSSVGFQVTSVPPGPGIATIYPNPFNPNAQVVTIAITDAGGATNIGYYIFDMTAHQVARQVLGTAQTTWDGKDMNNQVVGDGAFILRVINEDTKTLLARGKILVVKR